MRKRGSARTSARSKRARPRNSTSARSSSSSGVKVPAALRAQLASALGWHDAHADFEAAVAGVPAELRGRTPPGLPHSLWQLLEHLRLTQHDILDFCRNPDYVAAKWPDDYWPKAAAPPTAKAWDGSIAAFRRDLQALQRLAADPAIDLFAKVPAGSGQTYLRELILIIDHNAHHLGQLILVRRLLGAWSHR